MRTRALLLLCSLAAVPALARAQTAGVMVPTESSATDRGGRNDQVINIAECQGIGDTLKLDWTVNGTWVSTWSSFHLFATTASDCSSATGNALASNVAVTSGSASGSVTGVDVRSKIVTPFSVTCSGTAPTNIRLCASVYDSQGAALGATATMAVTFDFAVPDPPVGVSITPGDTALNVSWTAATTGATADSFTATATPVAPGAGDTCTAGGAGGSCSVTGSTSCRIGGLTNSACYRVAVVGYSASNNPSSASAAAAGVPVPVDDFWRHYRAEGGREQGGCGGPAGLPALLALLPLLPRLRRRKP